VRSHHHVRLPRFAWASQHQPPHCAHLHPTGELQAVLRLYRGWVTKPSDEIANRKEAS
jgi:hypothetical protein